MAPRKTTNRDPYYRCELHCNHDLGHGMSVAELLGTDGRSGSEIPRGAGVVSNYERVGATGAAISTRRAIAVGS